MTRSISCDVCDKVDDISQADLYFVLQIPHVNLEGSEPVAEEPLMVDLCSVECMRTVVDSLDRDQVPLSPASAQEPEDTSEPIATDVEVDEFGVAHFIPDSMKPTFEPRLQPMPARITPRNRLTVDEPLEGEVTVDRERPRPF